MRSSDFRRGAQHLRQRLSLYLPLLFLGLMLVGAGLWSRSAHAAPSSVSCTTTEWRGITGAANTAGFVSETVSLQGLYDARSSTFCGQLRAFGTITLSPGANFQDTYEVGIAPQSGSGTFRDVAVSGTGTWSATTSPIQGNCISFASGFLLSVQANDGVGADIGNYCV